MGTWQSCVEANMGHARRWASVALVGFVAACLSWVVPGPARAEEEALGWKISGGVEAGGIFPWGNRQSAQWDKYRDMTSGFLGELNVSGEKKDAPWFFELNVLNPGRTDQLYDGAIGRYGLFRLEGGWNQDPVVLSNSAYTIFTPTGGDTFIINPALRQPLINAYTAAAAIPGAALVTPPGLSPATRNTISQIPGIFTGATVPGQQGLLQPVSLRYSANVGNVDAKYTPTEALRFDVGWMNIYNQGNVSLGTVIGSPGGSPTELAIPISNQTNQFNLGAEYAKQDWGLQFNYIGSFFGNYYNGYTWQNPVTAANTATATAMDRISAPPDNSSNTFNLTGTVALPLRTRINATFGYTNLRQNATFDYNTANPALQRQNWDDSGMTSLDGRVNQYLGNVVLTSRPIDQVSVTARYRFFEYQPNTPEHSFSYIYPGGTGPAQTGEPELEGYTRQNFAFDLGYRPFRDLNLKAGAEYVNTSWSQAEGQNFSNGQYLIRLATDWNPTDWFLGRVTYVYQNKSIGSTYQQSTALNGLPNAIPYNYAPNNGNNVNVLLQFPIWEALTPSLSAGYSNTSFNQNQYGLKSTNYWTLGANLDWNPMKWLTVGGDVSYEQYNYNMASVYGTAYPLPNFNKWTSTSQDQYYNFGLNATVDIIPKKLIVTAGYNASLGYTTIQTSNPAFVPTPVGAAACATCTNVSALAYSWNQVRNIFQSARVVAKFFVTEKISVRGGFAWEGYSEKDFARDPMQQFMGFYENIPALPVLPPPGGYSSTLSNAGIQSVYLGSTVPGYNAYVVSAYVRYDF